MYLRPVRRCTAATGGSKRSAGETREEVGRSVAAEGGGSVEVRESKRECTCVKNEQRPPVQPGARLREGV